MATLLGAGIGIAELVQGKGGGGCRERGEVNFGVLGGLRWDTAEVADGGVDSRAV